MDQTLMPIAFERRVSRRLVRRVIRRHRDIGGFAREVPHERGYALPAEELDAEDRAELGAPPTGLVVLLADDADDAEVARTRLELQIFSTWEDLRRRGHLPRSAIRERIHRVGTTEMAEVRAVLRAQRRLLPARRGEPRDGVTWSLFAAYWAELRVFDDERLANELPTLAARHDEIDRLLAADVPWPIPPRSPQLGPRPPSAHDAEPAAIPPSPPVATRPELRALAARLIQLDARGDATAWAELLAEADDRRLVIDLKKACRDAEQPLARGDLLRFIASSSAHGRVASRPSSSNPTPSSLASRHSSLPRTCSYAASMASSHHTIAYARPSSRHPPSTAPSPSPPSAPSA